MGACRSLGLNPYPLNLKPETLSRLQEMANILDMIIAAKGGSPDPAGGDDGEGLGPDMKDKAAADSGSDAEAEDGSDAEAEGSDEEGGHDGEEAEGDGPAKAVTQGGLQTLVFSATLTLPLSLRRRLRKGAG